MQCTQTGIVTVSHTQRKGKSQPADPGNRTDTDVHRYSPPHRQVKTITTNCATEQNRVADCYRHTHSQVKKERELTVPVN